MNNKDRSYLDNINDKKLIYIMPDPLSVTTIGPQNVAGLITQLSEKQTNCRISMEDFSFAEEFQLLGWTVGIYGVCDGHSGKRAAKFLATNMKAIFEEGLSQLNARIQLMDGDLMRKVFVNCFANAEVRLENELGPLMQDGSTCSMVFAVPQAYLFYTINCGDSAVFGIHHGKDVTKPLSISPITRLHKPDDPDETARIKACGGHVVFSAGAHRLGGVLACSRSFGDIDLRNVGMTERPDVMGPLKFGYSGTDYLGLIIVTDGISDFYSLDEMTDLLLTNLGRKYELASLITTKAPSMDNASTISLFLP
jgi:serine/threonine protein phosphatase PrpC